MLVNPKQKLTNTYFYNNLLLILSVFAVLCISTSLWLEISSPDVKKYSHLGEGQAYGPIVVTKKPVIYELKTHFRGDNDSAYIFGEVLDEEKDTLYEFGKDAWHESGYDSDGYWSEADEDMTSKLTFSQPGTYYIKFGTEDNKLFRFNITISKKSGSSIPHLMLGCCTLLFLIIAFVFLNLTWVKEKLAQLNDKLEEFVDA